MPHWQIENETTESYPAALELIDDGQLTEYPAARRVLETRYMDLSDDELEQVLQDAFPGADPDDVENFMRTLQRLGRRTAPLVKRTLPGIAGGASQGGTIGGPWGALIGGVLGGAGSLLGGAGRQPQRPVVPGRGPVRGRRLATPKPARGAKAAPAPSAAMVARLLALLSQPQTMQALLAMLMSQSGRRSVRVGQQRVPAAAFANAIAEFAAAAADAADVIPEQTIPGHLQDEMGRARADVANPLERASLLLNDLTAVPD